MTDLSDAIVWDLRGLRCPMPLLKLKQALHKAQPGCQLSVLTSDTGAQRDIPAFLQHTPHVLLAMETRADGATQFRIQVAH